MDGSLALVRASDLPSDIVSVDRTGSVQVIGRLQGQAFDGAQWPVMALPPIDDVLPLRSLIPLEASSGITTWNATA
jgi:hypothetical protein